MFFLHFYTLFWEVFFFLSDTVLHFYSFSHCFEMYFSVGIYMYFYPLLWENYFQIWTYLAILNFYTLLCKSFFFCRNLNCTLTLLHTASKKYFSLRNYLENFQILTYFAFLHFYTMLWKSIFLSEFETVNTFQRNGITCKLNIDEKKKTFSEQCVNVLKY